MTDFEGRLTNSPAVEGDSVSFRFGKHTVLDGLNITVQRGVIYGLLGPSGCGKTTLLRCIVGRHRPHSGSIKVYGKFPGQRGSCIPGPGVGFMPQELALYPEITTKETLTYFGRIYQMSDKDIKDRISFLADFLDIPDKNRQIKKLSGGQQRRVSFATALIHKPPLVILDEPTVGVDPLLRKSIWNYLERLATVDFLTIIITTHYVEEARQAHVVGLMRDGRLLAEADPEYLMKKHKVITLEDVFLKLCVNKTDKNAGEVQEGSNPADETSEIEEESVEDVWVLKKAQRNYNCLPMTSVNGCDYKATLLDNPSDQKSVLNQERTCATEIRASAMRMSALLNKNIVGLKRNIPLVLFEVFVPAFQVIVFCLCMGGNPHNLPLAVVNQETDPSGKSNFFLQHLNPVTIHQVPYTNLTLAFESVQKGENWGVLYIRPTFTDSMINRYLEPISVDNATIVNSTITLYLDMTNQQIAMTLHMKILEGFQEFAENVLKQFWQNPLLASPPVALGPPIYGHKNLDLTEFMAPGMILGITHMMAFGMSTLSIIIEKKEGLLDRSWIAGVRSWEVMFSMLLILFVILIFQVIMVLCFTFLAFNLSCLGSLVWVVITALLVGLEGMAYGLLISSIVNNENIAVIISMGSFYPNFVLSGIVWPVEAMPYYLRQLSYCMPLTLITNTFRSVLSRGWSIVDYGIWNGYVVAITWIVPFIIISCLFFKYKK